MGVRYIEKCIANRVSSQQSVSRKMQKFSVEFCENTKCENIFAKYEIFSKFPMSPSCS